ncbi:SDR family NAD(P)-dependent oxidoreductase [Natronospirillum operosum]|uniref:SDR family NAD(P)-dependent oxidoreductase n=1 Tax=Natronospirillum operosum TaxID=2759953 RepID=A0A4Z0WBG1_9GAMM|nr:SDR family NAD(P)-dependent oxidoreductase [Natronospirillum operosum]TGG90609.1 SDR family NAD(P)-dependent oxidoreductase [Natronospirillum operosum]
MRPDTLNCVVTGASSGLGAGTARHLAGLGARVTLADLNEEAGEALAAELGPGARFIRTDITREEDASRCFDAALEQGPLTGLINCAGIPGAARVLGRKGVHDLDAFARSVQVNLVGTFNMVRLGAAAMAEHEPDRAGERGVIINTASIAAWDGQIGQAAYAASKGGIVSMTLPLARELAAQGIRVMTIAPGLFRTPMMEVLPEDVQQSLGASVPFPPRLGDPDEFAALVSHIIGNPMLNGEVIRLDGALRMAPR